MFGGMAVSFCESHDTRTPPGASPHLTNLSRRDVEPGSYVLNVLARDHVFDQVSSGLAPGRGIEPGR